MTSLALSIVFLAPILIDGGRNQLLIRTTFLQTMSSVDNLPEQIDAAINVNESILASEPRGPANQELEATWTTLHCAQQGKIRVGDGEKLQEAITETAEEVDE